MHRYDHRADDDYYSQAGELFRLMNAEQQELLVSNIVGAMKSVPEFVQKRQVAHFKKADPRYGERVEKGLEGSLRGDPRQVPITK